MLISWVDIMVSWSLTSNTAKSLRRTQHWLFNWNFYASSIKLELHKDFSCTTIKFTTKNLNHLPSQSLPFEYIHDTLHIMNTSAPLSKLGTPGPYHQVTLPFRPRCTLAGSHPSDPVNNPISTGSPRSWMTSMSKRQLWAISKGMDVISEFSLDGKRPIEPEETLENYKKHKIR